MNRQEVIATLRELIEREGYTSGTYFDALCFAIEDLKKEDAILRRLQAFEKLCSSGVLEGFEELRGR